MKPHRGEIWKHLKTGHLYRILGNCRNMTNAQNGQAMVNFMRKDNSGSYCVRDTAEFMQKFELVSSVPERDHEAIRRAQLGGRVGIAHYDPSWACKSAP